MQNTWPGARPTTPTLGVLLLAASLVLVACSGRSTGSPNPPPEPDPGPTEEVPEALASDGSDPDPGSGLGPGSGPGSGLGFGPGSGRSGPGSGLGLGPGSGRSDPGSGLGFGSGSAEAGSRAPAPRIVGDARLMAVAETNATGFQLHTAGGDVTFLTGVNVGSALPGLAPVELGIEAETWRRWFPMMAATGIHALRIYTLQPPHFYSELVAYNEANPDHPLYLVHGVWVPEEALGTHHDTFHPAVVGQADADIDQSVAALHGDITLPPRRGFASGTYTADVSPWVVSWAFGIEMDPEMVVVSDATNAGRTYQGHYITAHSDATPTEVWLAERLDRLATAEAAYGRTMPLTFSNWPTTDPLDHPTEPLAEEDLVGIDANRVRATDAWPGGVYASYHAYPYYPDFVWWEPGVADYQHRDRTDPYAGYLERLRRHHGDAGLSTMILEFGVPSSIGSAHAGPLGRDQGGHHEAEAMAINADLLRVQYDLGLAGGFVFSWHDEWFKRTWNTMDTEIPAGRRPLWPNPLTNEASFGLLAMDPGPAPPAVVDGDDQEWRAWTSQAIYESPGAVREVRASHDQGYLYLRLKLDQPEVWMTEPIQVGFDVVPGGNGGLPHAPLVGVGADTAVVVGPGSEAGAWVRALNDINTLLMGGRRAAFKVGPDDKAHGRWNPQRLILSYPLDVPATGEHRPAQWFDLNPLVTGSSDPTSPEFDSRTTWAAAGDVIELRIPWAMVGFADPSSLAALKVSADGEVGTVETPRLGISVAVGTEGTDTDGYAWEPWDTVTWTERPKDGLELFVQAVTDVTRP